MKRHSTDVFSLLTGIALVWIGTAALIAHRPRIGLTEARYLFPALLVAAGIAGLVATIRPNGRSKPAEPTTSEDGDAASEKSSTDEDTLVVDSPEADTEG